MTLDDLRTLVNVAGNTRNADRWTAEEWIKLYEAYKACEYDLTPDRWSYHQTQAAILSGVVPEFNDDESPKPFTIDAHDRCPACNAQSGAIAGWVTGDCGTCGAPLRVESDFTQEIGAVLAQLEDLDLEQRIEVLQMALDTLSNNR